MTAVVLVVAAYLAVVIFVAIAQRRLQYFPDRHVATPSGPDYGGLEEVEIPTEDGERLQAWYWPGERSITLLIFHGNGGNRSHRLWWLALLQTLQVGVLIVDYRGYGGSTGRPTEEGLYRDGRATRDWLDRRQREDGRRDRIVYVGESLGCAVAVELAARRRPDGLVLHAPFWSALEIARGAYPFLPVRWLMRDRFETWRRMPDWEGPLLVFHGERDDVVPIDSGRRLFALAPGQPKFVTIPEAGHNDLPFVDSRRYLAEWQTYLAAIEECDDPEGRPK